MLEENPLELEAILKPVTAENHETEIEKIIAKHFNVKPKKNSRMRSGICNEVYLVALADKEVVIRLNKQKRFLLGSHKYIPLFKSRHIRVPEILAEDYSKTFSPYAYHILSKIEGQDIDKVIDSLTDDELKKIATEISNVFNQLRTVPTNGKFGVRWGDDNDLQDSWTAEISRMSNVVMGWGKETGILDDELEGILDYINHEYKTYFDSVRSILYFGDMSSKNVMIHQGKFNGLVDLDSLAQGDYLETIGRIKASWYGTHWGQVYAEAIMNEQKLDKEQRKLVTMYALLNRTYWTLENGKQFNQNTTAKVDWNKNEENKKILRKLQYELKT